MTDKTVTAEQTEEDRQKLHDNFNPRSQSAIPPCSKCGESATYLLHVQLDPWAVECGVCRAFIMDVKPVAAIEHRQGEHARIVRSMDISELRHGTKLFARVS